jgi:hypothetical protein
MQKEKNMTVELQEGLLVVLSEGDKYALHRIIPEDMENCLDNPEYLRHIIRNLKAAIRTLNK